MSLTNLNTMVQRQYVPTLGLIVFKSIDENREEDHYYIESHDIGPAGQLMEGKPLKTETIAAIGQMFRDKSKQETMISGAIPKCLLHYKPSIAGDYSLIWHRPSGKQHLHFTAETKIKSGLAMVPPLLFKATASHLKVWGLTSNRRPGMKTMILAAPFHNVNSAGDVCLGSAKVRTPSNKTFENLIEYWEQMFWGSKFSAVHNEKAVKGGLVKVWRSQLARPNKPFPMHLMPPTEVTFQQIINGRF